MHVRCVVFITMVHMYVHTMYVSPRTNSSIEYLRCSFFFCREHGGE